MAAKSVLTIVTGTLQFPFMAVSRIAERFNLWNVRTEVDRCLKVIDSFDRAIPGVFAAVLVAAEDHRSEIHAGVDPIAMIRALSVRIRWNRIEGASTIEQQLVRTVLGCYERSIQRKIREQAIAMAVSRQRNKHQIAIAYLSIAFYGSGCTGIAGLSKRCGGDLQNVDRHTILEMVARLKYPEPVIPTSLWRLKINRRVRYIEERMSTDNMPPSALINWPSIGRVRAATRFGN
jgi:monofunctional glycosyltransferase